MNLPLGVKSQGAKRASLLPYGVPSTLHCLSLTHLDLPVICCHLVEFYSQLKADLCVLEGTVCLYGDGVPVLLDDCGRLGHASHLPGGKAHT